MENSCAKFGMDIMKFLIEKDSEKNLIYSPLSIYIALGMTLYGAQGVTSAEMMKTLHWNENNSNDFHQQLSDCQKRGQPDKYDTGDVRMTNRLFLEKKYELLESYVKAMEKFYSGAIEKKDFQGNANGSRQEINSWVETETNGKIKDLIPGGSVKESTRLILVNAVYFKGSWVDEFSVIGQKDFLMSNGVTKPIEMMARTKRFQYVKNDDLGFAAVQIPFKTIQQKQYSLMIILPNERNSLTKLQKSIFQHEWNSILGENVWQSTRVHLTMPKFKVECSFSLKKTLETLGMKNPFSPAADFSLMTGNRDLKIDEVIHKAFIDIDEKGAEAAAATAIMMLGCCATMVPEDPIELNCDHSFMFALVQRDCLPFFMGHFTFF